MVTPTSGGAATSVGEADRIRVLTTAITAPRAKHRWPLPSRRREAVWIDLQKAIQQAAQALSSGFQEAAIARTGIAEAHAVILAGEDDRLTADAEKSLDGPQSGPTRCGRAVSVPDGCFSGKS
jgi:hypothetical protein